MPPPLTNSSWPPGRRAPRGRRSTISRQAAADVALRGRLHRADRGASQRPAGDPVADAGDLALVGHQPGEAGAGPRLDLLGHPRAPGRRRGSASASGRSAPSGRRAATSRRRGRGRRGPARGPPPIAPSIRSRWGRSSTISTGARPGSSAASRATSAIAAAVGRRVGDDDVVESLRERGTAPRATVNASTPRKPASRSRIRRRTRGRAHRLRGDPDRHARPPGRASPRRWRAARRGRRTRTAARRREDRVVARVRRLAIDVRGRSHSAASVPSLAADTADPGEVAEWLKALAC